MRLLLDTVTFLLAIESSHRISRTAMSELQNPKNDREISVISIAEISTKSAIGKLSLSREGLMVAIEDLQMRILPYTSDHVMQLFDLPLHHRDPFDRQIIAQAMSENIPVVTCDPQFRLYKGLRVIW